MRAGWGWIAAALLGLGADDPAPKADRPEVNLPGLKPAGTVLLPNGWSLKPAGRQTPLGDFPIAIAENPKHPVLAILHAGYGDLEVWTIDAQTGKTLAKTALPATFAGLAWSPDGDRLYVGGGFDDVVHVFDHKDGLLSNKVVFEVSRAASSSSPNHGSGVRRNGQKAPALPEPGWHSRGDGKHPLRRQLPSATPWRRSTSRPAKRSARKFANSARRTYPVSPWCLDEPRDRVICEPLGRWRKLRYLDLEIAGRDQGHFTPREEHPNEMLAGSSDDDALFVANANRNTVTVDRHSKKTCPWRRSTPPSTLKAPDGQHAKLPGGLAG